MVVGSSDILTSSDGITWTQRGSANVDILAVNYANSTFVAVGSGSSVKIRTSTDGTSWTTRTSETKTLWGVTYGNNTHVAVGNTKSLVYSTDGISWTYKQLFNGGYNLMSIIYKE